MARSLSTGSSKAGLAGTYKRYGGPVSSSGTTFYTTPNVTGDEISLVESVSCSNVAGSNITVTVKVLNSSDSVISTLIDQALLVGNTGLEVVQNKVVLQAGEKLQVITNSNQNCHATIAILEIDS